MRISTAGIHHAALTALLSQQSVLSQTQGQIASGKRVQTPADDPVAAVHIMELQRALSESDQFDRNADMAKSRLTLEEQALADANTLMQRVHELTVQGNNASVDPASRKMLATEVRSRLKELMDIANRRDANGEYLFSGFATLTQPFAQTGSTISYFGDQGARALQIGQDQRVVDGHSGTDAFMAITEGNGTFVTNATAGNAGSGVIAGGTLANPAQWVQGDYTLRFTSATGDYEIVDSAATVVATGTYTENSTISFNGANLDMTGMPAQNDSFSIARSRSQDVFTTLSNLAATLESSTATTADRAQFNSSMATALQQLDQASDHLLSVRAEVGTRLSAIDGAQEALADRKVELETTTSQLRDLDYAEAVSRMNQQLVGLQAAQASYSKIAQLSLFDYLR
ncbi:MAG TPA: flagellar hook-associated protein FlgL [Steroidobacteraceae bacterium]|jgi:flagellar hook-associated protein 3 FlgL|nr:flagellar hook-associated protein FlgL [Steroidobacteraceae bacterium]